MSPEEYAALPKENDPHTLTARNLAVYKMVYEFTRDNGYQPTYREIAQMLGSTNQNMVFSQLVRLERFGYLCTPQSRSNRMRQYGIQFLKKPDGSPFKGFKDR
jgi:SOS-response transcriptional repressor LexA